ncbi:Organic cation transporter protein-like 12 [Homarus americanus]|uniref:Organic cation transporter protein-like 12 n=1 Tax=Homarus americanus TaxID=6706 RepID=A0A8J5N1W1_HOMAM|nr:Organic cation transporter protein-like 12 [Homarus americanus]
MSGDDCIDEVLSVVGCGWWLSPIFMATAIANAITIQRAATTFITAPLPFRCSSPDDLPRLAYTVLADSTNNTSNSTTITEVDSTPWYNSKCLDTTSSSTHTLTVDFISLSSSSVDPGRHSTGLLSCPVIEYDRSLFISSIFSEFHLVCERTSLRPLYQQMLAMGGILGSWIVGPLADLLGRKRGILVGGLLGLPACLGVALAPWYPVVMLLRLVVGGCNRMIIISCTVLLMETTPPKYRSVVGIFMGIPYGLSLVVFAISGYFVREWRYLQLICVLPVCLILPFYLTLNESPRWLAQHGRGKEAAELLVRASEYNRSPIPGTFKPFLDKLRKQSQEPPTSPQEVQGQQSPKEAASKRLVEKMKAMCQYFRSPAMLVIMLVTPLMWFLVNIIFFAITLNANNFTSTSPFFYVGLLGALQAIAYLATIPANHKLGRRKIIGGGGFLSAVFILLDMAQKVWWSPGVTIAGSGFLLSLVVSLLPETNLKPMPESLQDVEDRIKTNNSSTTPHSFPKNLHSTSPSTKEQLAERESSKEQLA